MAERNEGADWKALPHAVRTGHEAIGLPRTATVTFPLPDAVHVLAIKQGRVPYAELADEIERLLAGVEAAQETTCLPHAADQSFIGQLIRDAYRAQLCRPQAIGP